MVDGSGFFKNFKKKLLRGGGGGIEIAGCEGGIHMSVYMHVDVRNT